MSQHPDDALAEALDGLRKDWAPGSRSGDLFSGESFWRDHQPWLLERGYQLRARYQPNWKPSWKASGRSKQACEDSYPPKRVTMMDAVRVSDGAFVMFKQVDPAYHPYEVEIGEYLSGDALRMDAQNHSVPLLEVLQVPDDDSVVLLVMPLLRKFNDPPFLTLGEVVECVRQAFEGVQFMHKHNIAHRDCSGPNFMLDPSGLYPTPFHPVLMDRTRDIRSKVRPLARSECSVKYYWIDFGIACKYRPEERPPSEKIVKGADKSPPEHKDTQGRCDPFLTDVYYAGNLVRKNFLEEYRNTDFLEALVKRMVQDNPTKRPSMDDVMKDFSKLVKGLGRSKLNARLVNRQESLVGTIVRDTSHTIRGLFSRASSSRQVGSSKSTRT